MKIRTFIYILCGMAIGVPILINVLFKIDIGSTWLSAEWEAGELLQYWGTVFSSIIAIVGVYLTLKENRKENEKSTIQQVRPYLATDLTEYISLEEIADELLVSKDIVCIYDEYGSESIHLGTLNSGKNLREKIQDRNILKDYFVFRYKIRNIGLGNAMGMYFLINDLQFFPVQNISCGESITLYVMVGRGVMSKSPFELYIKCVYEDIIKKRKYEQHERVFITHVEGNQFITCRDWKDELSEQKVLD